MFVSNEGLQLVEPRPGIGSEAVWKIDAAILREEQFWLTEVYSLAIHSQDLILHSYVLQARLQDRPPITPIPRMNVFHNPETIELNARNVLSATDRIARSKYSLSAKDKAWAVLVEAVALYNLQLVDVVVETQNQLGLKNGFDRNAKLRTDMVLSPEEEAWLARANTDQIGQMASHTNYDYYQLLRRRSVLRRKFGLIGQIAYGQSWNNLSVA